MNLVSTKKTIVAISALISAVLIAAFGQLFIKNMLETGEVTNKPTTCVPSCGLRLYTFIFMLKYLTGFG